MNRLVKNDYFENSNPRWDEIKRLLDENGFKEKMEGMKRLIAMMSKGQDVSALYPDVVKNVVCPNMTVKKLVYMYIVHYAELEPDPALLAINNFQRDMQNENQLIRALGLRVLSSIRLRVIVQVIVLAVKKACKDGSPYVRKAAAHAIPKIYNLDHEQLPDLMEVLETLLKDRATMVLGSALWAFNEICPDRFDLLHPHFRKLCRLLADTDEWGQIVVLNTLTRYARTQFVNPDREIPKKEKKPKENTNLEEKNSSDEDEDEEESEEEDLYDGAADLDADHRLLLQSAVPLLRSRNSGVVMAVAALYYYLAPQSEVPIVGKALTRLMRDSREIQYVVLSNVSDMAATRPAMFSPFLLDFFVNTTDPVFIRRLKLEILTCIATETNISTILSELNFYVHMEDKDLVTASIQAIGRCATRLPEVADSCMRTLMVLISNPSEAVVAESVVVIKKLLQMGEKREFPLEDVVTHLAKLLPNVKVPKARASIVWVIGEYHHTIPLRAPDILRTLAKSFTEEDDTVKQQVLNLGSKLVQSNPEQTMQLFQYVLDLASYDLNYDVRDRARLMRRIMISSSCPILGANAKRLFITKKPAPVLVLESDQRQRYAVGSLSHLVGHKVMGYSPIPDFPAVPPETDRTSEEDLARGKSDLQGPQEPWTDTESSLSETDSEEDEDHRERKQGKRHTDEEDSSEYSGSESPSGSESYTDSYTDTESYSESESDTDEGQQRPRAGKEKQKPGTDNFLDFGISPGQEGTGLENGLASLEGLDLQGGNILAPHPTPALAMGNGSVATGVVLPKHQLLNQVTGGGLSIEYRFVRRASIHGPSFNTIQLIFTNHLAQPISNIRITNMNLPSGMQVMPFNDITVLPPGGTFETLISIAFASVTQSAKFEISNDRGSWAVSLQPILGELVKPRVMAPEEFELQQKKLGGMNEIAAKTPVHTDSLDDLTRAILEAFNLALCVVDAATGTLKLAGVTIFDDKPFLLSLTKEAGEVSVKINCENPILGAMAKTNLVKALASVEGTEKQS